jgi:hypothetical protein
MAIPFVIFNLDEPRKLRLGMGAMVEFEQVTGVSLLELAAQEHICPECGYKWEENSMTIEIACKLLWIMLKQENKSLTFEKSCDLIDNYAESVTEVITKVTEAVNIAFLGEKKPKNAKKPTTKN